MKHYNIRAPGVKNRALQRIAGFATLKESMTQLESVVISRASNQVYSDMKQNIGSICNPSKPRYKFSSSYFF